MIRARGWAAGGLLALGATLLIGGTAYSATDPSPSPSLSASPSAPGTDSPSPSDSASPSPSDSASPGPSNCAVDAGLVPSCGILWGAAADAHTTTPLTQAVHDFEQSTGRTQAVFHTYHRGLGTVWPTSEEIALANEPGHPRIPFINWKPATGTWADIAAGDPAVDGFIDKVAAHIKADFPTRKFFLTIHHEPENDVNPAPGSGMTATDYAAMFRHVVQRLRGDGVTNAVTVMTYMAYPKWCVQPWHDDLYPGDDVVDWVAWDVYASSAPGYGYGDFGELMNRGDGITDEIQDLVSSAVSTFAWPGFYNWAAAEFPGKPLMLGEWGVWYDASNASHKSWFFDNVAQEIANYPRIKAMVYFDSPDAEGRSSSVDQPSDALPAYQQLGALPQFQVDVDPPATASPSPTDSASPSESPTDSPSTSPSDSPSVSPSDSSPPPEPPTTSPPGSPPGPPPSAPAPTTPPATPSSSPPADLPSTAPPPASPS
jgi:hypothetical protein